jgi:peptidoglycan-associated lipoprotein
MMATRKTVLALSVVLVAAAACSKKKPEVAPPAPTPVAPPAAGGPNQDSIARANAERERIAREAAAAEEARRNAAAIAAVKATLTNTIYFDYDKDEIRDDQKAALEAKIPILQGNSGVRIRIAGHTDNRGSDEYNVALGQRRGAAVKRYLVSRGIADARIEVVSYGEERPAAQGDNEEAWSKNRRAEFEIIAGGDTIKGK